jgi:transcription elongation factor Elf1
VRMKPYTAIGIKRKKCVRCGHQASSQWQICAIGRQYVPICTACDIALNAQVLDFMDWPNIVAVMKKYREEKG